jgi:ketosteroid isomerase-like protein
MKEIEVMDLSQIQELFRVTDAGDSDKLRGYLHPDLSVTMLGVDGVDAPLDLDAYLAFIGAAIADREKRGERTDHIPTQVKIAGPLIAVRGYLRISAPGMPDAYHPYTDILKLRDGKIAEYNIAYQI